jgi:hypothetical protein
MDAVAPAKVNNPAASVARSNGAYFMVFPG